MTNFDDPVLAADETQQASRALAHATRGLRDPREIYSILGSLSAAAASLSQTLHQVASAHDGPPQPGDWVPAKAPRERAAAYQVSWELHRAGEIMRQVASAINHAHEVEATIAYTHGPTHDLAHVPINQLENGLGL